MVVAPPASVTEPASDRPGMETPSADDAGAGATREARHRAILASATAFAIIATDRRGRVTDWNVGAERLLGWSSQEMLDQPLDRLFTPEDRAIDRCGAEMRQALELDCATDERWRVRKDGGRFWACGEMTALRGPDGAHLGFLRILRDRTEQRLAADRDRSNVEFLHKVLVASVDCIKVLDLEARLLFMNEGGLRAMEAAEPEAMLGTCWTEFWPEKSGQDAVRAVELARAGGTGHFQGFAPTLAGTPRWWDVQVTAIPGADGRPEKLLVVSRDVTERRQANADIGNLAQLVEQSSDFIGVAGLDGRMLFVNPAGRRLVGLGEREAVRTLEIATFLMPGDQAVIAGLVLPAVRERGIWEGELQFRHAATGSPIPVLFTVFPLRDVQRVVTGYGIVSRDLRERRRADVRRTALLELGDRMRDLDDPAEMAFVAAEIMGRTLGVSRAGYGTLDAGGDTLLVDRDWTAPGCETAAGLHLMRQYGSYIENLRRGEIVAVADVTQDPRTSASHDTMRSMGVQALVNLPLIEQDRLVALFYINHERPRPWDDADISFVRDVAERTRDAIERRRAELRLRELALLLEQQVAQRTRERDRIWRVSQDLLGISDSDGRWISVNPAWEASLGWSADTFIGRTTEWLEHPDDRLATRAEVERLAAGQRTLVFENRLRARDGSYHWLSWTAVPEDGLFYCVGRDVTAEKAAADALRQAGDWLHQSQKMEAVGQLTGGLAHDFNNLLTGISGSLELMGTRIAQGRVAEVDRYIAAAQGAARRAASLTHRLLAFSRRQALDPRAVGINQLVTGLVELIGHTVGPSVAIEVIPAAGLWTALVDTNQLENALLNLCINARDAMSGGGRITIETANTRLDKKAARELDLPPGDYVSLCVGDTGSGMTPDVIARAFEPFFTTKPVGQGTGLGLSMIYGFARQSGGGVRIRSELNVGTTLCLYLPRHLGVEDADDATATPDQPGAEPGETVLVVDDEAMVRLLVVETLVDLGYRAIEAADGPTGLALLRSDIRIDLLVTDMGLPGGVNGRQLADAGRGVRPGLKVLFITGYAATAIIGDEALEPGMHMLTKPFAMDVLAGRIRALISDR